MLKNRNSFFESSNFNMNAMSQNMNMSSMPNFNNFQDAVPTPLPIYPNINTGGMQSSTLTELESRIARLERNINRLDARLNKLEGTTFYSNNNYETDGTMYMV